MSNTIAYRIDQAPNRDVIIISESGSDRGFFANSAVLMNPVTITTGTGGGSIGPDLTALEALTGTNNIYYRSAADTWSPVTFSSDVSFSGGNITSYAPVTLSKKNGSQYLFGLGTTTDIQRGDALLSAISSSSVGDSIKLSPDDFNIGTGQIRLLPSGTLYGEGIFSSKVIGDRLYTQGAIVNPSGKNCIIHDLSIIATGDSSAPFGAYSSDTAYIDLVSYNTFISGNLYGYYNNKANCSSEFYNCILKSKETSIAQLGSNSTSKIYNCSLVTNGLYQKNVAAVYINTNTTIDIYDSTINSINGSGFTRSVWNNVDEISSAIINIYNTIISTSSTGINVNDLYNDDIGIISVNAGTVYTGTVFGTITKSNIFGVPPSTLGINLLSGTQASARTNLGLGTIATQNANAVNISGLIVTGDISLRNGTTNNLQIYNSYSDSNNYERLNIGFAGNIAKIQCQSGTGGGTARLLQVYQSAIVSDLDGTNYINSNQCNTYFVNNILGATFYLPFASGGLGPYTFIVANIAGMTINANSGDIITVSPSLNTAISGYISSTGLGSSITLISINDSAWQATSMIGSWSVF